MVKITNCILSHDRLNISISPKEHVYTLRMFCNNSVLKDARLDLITFK